MIKTTKVYWATRPLLCGLFCIGVLSLFCGIELKNEGSLQPGDNRYQSICDTEM